MANILDELKKDLSPLDQAKLPMNEGDAQTNLEMQQAMGRQNLVARINSNFEEAETARYIPEDQWLKIK